LIIDADMDILYYLQAKQSLKYPPYRPKSGKHDIWWTHYS